MVLPEQKKKLRKAKIAVALQNERGRVPKEEEINQVFLLARGMDKACWVFIFSGRNKNDHTNWRCSTH